MAVIKTGALVADIRGKVGTNVFSRGQGGAVVRDIGTWVQPDNEAQQAVRDAIEALSKAWSLTLTTPNRDAWRTYAHTNPRPNRWGALSLTNGYSCFIRHNFHAYLDNLTVNFPSAPTAGPLHPADLTINIQQNGTIIVNGTTDPDCSGTFLFDGTFGNYPSWYNSAKGYYLWHELSRPEWTISTSSGEHGAAYWQTVRSPTGMYQPRGTATGHPEGDWSYGESFCRIITPPLNYAPAPEGLTLYVYSGIPINAGRSYYSGPYLKLITIIPEFAAVPSITWARWTWPTRSVEPPWTWPTDGSGSTRAIVIAQDAITGSISSKSSLTPTCGSLDPW